MSYKPQLNLIDFDSNSHDDNCPYNSNICSDCLANPSSSPAGSYFCVTNSPASTKSDSCTSTSSTCPSSSSSTCPSSSSSTCTSTTESCTKSEVRTIIKEHNYIVKIGSDIVIPKGIRTVLVESDNRQIKIVLPCNHLKCISTPMGTVYSSPLITIVNLGCGMIIIKPPAGSSIAKKIKYILKAESSVTFQQFDNVWYPISN